VPGLDPDQNTLLNEVRGFLQSFQSNTKTVCWTKPRQLPTIRNLSSSLFYLWLYSPCGPWPLGQLFNLYTVVRTPCTGDQPVARPLPTHRTTQTQNKRKQTSMPQVGFESTIPVFERAKTVHALDRVTTVIGPIHYSVSLNHWTRRVPVTGRVLNKLK
jgi:hypothetical protein